MLNTQYLSCDNVQLIITKSSLYKLHILYKILDSGYIYSENQIKDLIDKKWYDLIKAIYTVKYMSINIFKYCVKHYNNVDYHDYNTFNVAWIETIINKNKIVITEDMLLDLLEDKKNDSSRNELIIQYLKRINT